MKLSKWLCIMGLLLLTAACEKEDFPKNLQNMQFNSSIEALTSSDNSKVFLYKEQWVFWELGDQISIGSDQSTGGSDALKPQIGDLVNASPGTDFENFNGVFIAPLPENSKYFVALHPQRSHNVITGTPDKPNMFTVQIDLPAEQPRTPYGGTDEDLTFARKIFPMSAWIGNPWDALHPDPYQLDFHALGGIVRLQLYNITGKTNTTLQSIVIEARDGVSCGAGIGPAGSTGWGSECMQINGLFNVIGYNTSTPYLEPTAPTPSNPDLKKITLTFGSGLEFNSSAAGQGDIKTFYLVLPALGDNNWTTTYKLHMTVNAKVAGEDKQFEKDFSVPIRRRGLTNLRALGIDNWDDAPAAGLAGNGTADRPFKIYTLADMQYLRNHYNGDRKLNGQPIDENTHIVLMRSDITLGELNWTSAIQDFVGFFDDSTHAKPQPGIKNVSNVPIFQNINAGGHVRHLTVKTDNTVITTTSTTGVSPFCNVNKGLIELCVVTGSVRASDADLAGLAGQNLEGGIIRGCACEASLTVTAGHKAAGICLNNSGRDASDNLSTITGCYATGSLTVNATEAAGICYGNNAVVRDCYFSATVSGSARWGGIVYQNSATVEHCYASTATSLTTTATVGGIVHTLDNGTVNDCWMEGNVQGSSAGGVVYNVIGGKVINCFVDGSGISPTVSATGVSGVAGGLVGTLSGAGSKVENSYVYDISISGNTKGGLIGTITGGSVTNCYSYESSAQLFYGSKSGSPTLSRCYAVAPMSAQDGVTSVTSAKAVAASGTTGALIDLLNADTRPTGGYLWTFPTGMINVPPILSTSTSKHARWR